MKMALAPWASVARYSSSTQGALAVARPLFVTLHTAVIDPSVRALPGAETSVSAKSGTSMSVTVRGAKPGLKPLADAVSITSRGPSLTPSTTPVTVKLVEFVPAGMTTEAGNAAWPAGAALRFTVSELVGGVFRVTVTSVEPPSAITATPVETKRVGPSFS